MPNPKCLFKTVFIIIFVGITVSKLHNLNDDAEIEICVDYE